MLRCDSCAHTYICVPNANTFSTCVETRLGLRAKSDIDKRARNTESRVKLRREWAGKVWGYFTFRSILETAIYCAIHTYNTLELPLTSSCLGLRSYGPWLLNSFFINGWLAIIQATGIS